MAKYLAPRSPEVSRQETEHKQLVRQLAPQGMVLLENNGVLPLSGPGEVALFGAGARHTVKGGTGSGDVNSREVVNVEQGLVNAGFRVLTGSWLDAYDARLAEARAEHRALLKQKKAEDPEAHFILLYFAHPFVNPETPEITQAVLQEAQTELAVYVLSRNSGEGKDRLAEKGDYLLSDREMEDLRLLRANYKKLVVLLNVGGVMDTAFLRELGADALLLMSQAGAGSGDAVADCLLGITPPSGRLTDTWPLNYSDYPTAATFGSNDGNTDVEEYSEGIFVGYRYFDSFGKDVAYPFGYGLDYTRYETEAGWVEADQYGVTAKVKVVNTGSYKGRHVVQLYVTPPAGGLEKPHQVLVGFAKTRLLDPGASQTLSISFPLKNMASYCPACASWVLEPGKYYLRLAGHSRSSRIVAAVEVPQRTVLEELKDLLPLQQELQELSRAGVAPISYPGEEAEMAAAPVCTLPCALVETQTAAYRADDSAPVKPSETSITMADLLSGRFSPRDMAAQLSDEELAALCVGSGGSQSVIGAASVSVPGAAGETVSLLLEERDVRPLILADGPAGLRLTPHFVADGAGEVLRGGGFFAAVAGLEGLDTEGEAEQPLPGDAIDYYQYCTAIPIATLIAQSWDTELARKLGRMVGAEMQKFGVSLWLAPGMNIHRNALCGRNFEYYSEDPLLSGLMAAADTLGVQSVPGVGTTPKHFACNNQEDNRNFTDSVVSLRALREIYLRGFEICVRSAQPMSIMTSYNLINGTHAANIRDLLTHILRDEWGFAGFVMTDWGTTGSGEMPTEGVNSTPSLCIEAGNDLIMPGGPGDHRDILAALKGETAHKLSRDSLVTCAARILTVIRDSHLYPDSRPWTARFRTEWFLAAE